MSDITDLNPLSPTGNDPVSDGDNELRALKNALVGDGTPGQGSFTPSFSGQYTGSAANLNLVSTALQPTDDMDALADVVYGELGVPGDGDILQWTSDGAFWDVRSLPALVVPGSARYTGYAGAVGDQPVLTTEVSNSISPTLATVRNTLVDNVRGWNITANKDALITLYFTATLDRFFSPTNGNRTSDAQLGVGLNTVGTSLDQSAAAGRDWLMMPSADTPTVSPSSWNVKMTPSVSVSIFVPDGDFLTVSFTYAYAGTLTGTSVNDFSLNVSVQIAE